MKKVTAGGGVGVSWGLGDWVYLGWSMVLQKKSRESNSTAACVVMGEGGTGAWCITQGKREPFSSFNLFKQAKFQKLNVMSNKYSR